MNQPVLDLIGFAAGAVAALVDGRRAIGVACLAAGLGLAPSAATYGGGWAAVLVMGAGVAAAAAGPLAGLVGGALTPRPGVHPDRPVAGRPGGLFGPRSVRVAGGAVALVAASWVSLNVPVGSVVAVRGVLFPVAFVLLCGVLRLFVARTLSDLALGLSVAVLAVGVAWLLRGGTEPLAAAAGVVGLAPVAAAVDGWLRSRHRTTVAVVRP